MPIFKYGSVTQTTSAFIQTVVVTGDGDTTPFAFVLNDVVKPVLTLAVGDTYTLDQSGATNNGHPICIGLIPEDTNSALSSAYGVKYYINNVQVANFSTYSLEFSYVTTTSRKIVIEPNSSTPSNYYYFCANHSNMGNQIRTILTLSQAVEDFNIIPDSVYGSGKDGTVTISTNTDLNRDTYYSNLTIAPGVHLNTNGYKVFVRNILTFSSAISDQATTSIGLKNGFSGLGSLAGGSEVSVSNSLGGDGLGHAVSLPTVSSGGPEYYNSAINAINGYSLGGANATPLALRGGAGNGSAPGGGVVVVAARKFVGYGTIYANGYYNTSSMQLETGGGVILLVSQFVKPSSIATNVTGYEAGTVKEILV
jgi:hypothetical protein